MTVDMTAATDQDHRALPSLTGIRGIAAVLVVAYHVPIQNVFRLDGDPVLIGSGSYGVDLFFILSGFILFYTYSEKFRFISRENVKSFYKMRFFRVYPLHFVVLMLILAYVLAVPDFVAWFRGLPSDTDGVPFSALGFLQSLTLTNRIGLPEQGVWNGPSWSLSSEVLGYAVFPFITYGLVRLKSPCFCYLLAAASLAAFAAILFIRGHIGVPRMMFCFFAGTCLGRARQLDQAASRWAAPIANLSALASLALLIVPHAQPLSVFGFAGLIYGLSLGPSVTDRALSSGVAMFLGRISFSLYLTHFMVLLALEWSLWGGQLPTSRPWLTLAGLAGVCLLAAIAAYRLIERPSHRLARRMARRHEPSGDSLSVPG